ncbi:lipid phosphate phosphatase 2-like [Coffea arabica]|uniref:Lipid phosphate phosphatase 2-like n=1 Tax=Coffea arabica TaxID=13443 RepID=A0A6P6XBZ3_COFAR
MPGIQFGGHTLKSHGTKVARVHLHDWIILLLLVLIDAGLNLIEPFHRYVGPEMMTDLKYPLKIPDTIPFWAVPIFAIIVPCTIFLIYYLIRRDVYDLHHATLGILFSILVTAVITDSIKDAVGRPRPDFFWRCFPDGVPVFKKGIGDVLCSGDQSIIKEGYKSFPSGHTSWSFAGLGFLSWYLCGKIKAFDQRGHVAKLCLVILPLLVAALIGISRVDDYWHHWTDVFAGALIGSVVCSLCYLQFFPFPHGINGGATHTFLRLLEENGSKNSTNIEMDHMRNHVTATPESRSQDLDAMENGRRY